jgi:hypothetical protein
MRRRYLLAVLAIVLLAGAGLWAWLAPPSTECTPKPDDPDQHLVRICRYLRANEIDVSPGSPNGYRIRAIEDRVEDGHPVLWVFLSCCYMGDVAVIDKATGEVIRFQASPQ